MNNIFKKIISGIITASMLMSSAVAVYAEGETETTSPWAVAKGANTFRFGVMTDIHTMPNDSNNVIQYMNMGLDAYNEMGVDGLALPGDIVMSGKTSTDTTIEENLYDKLTENLNTYGYEIKSEDDTKNDPNKKPLAYGMGNHEMASNHQNATGIWAAKDLFVTANGIDDLTTARTHTITTETTDETTGEVTTTSTTHYTGDYVTEMGGYTFIVSSANYGLFENANYKNSATIDKGVGVDIESWVKEKIEEATATYKAAGTPNKPIFYIQHIPAQSHTGMTSYKTNSDDFMNWLKDYPNVVILSGHTHNLIDDPRVISQDAGYTSIVSGVMATGNASVWGATLDSTLTSGGTSGPKQSMAIDVTYNETEGTSDIKVYRLDIQNKRFIGEPFEFTINGNAQTKYSIADRFANEGKSTVAWDEGATMTAVIPEGTRDVNVTFDIAATVTGGASVDLLQDNFVWGYKAFAINALTNIAEKSTIRAAEFYKTTKTSPRTFTFSNLDRNQQYDIAIYPVTVFQQKMTYQELDAAGIVPMTATVKIDNIKTDTDRAKQTVKNTLVSAKKSATLIQHPDTVTTKLTDNSTSASVSEESENDTPGVGFIVDLERSYKITEIDISVESKNSWGRDAFIIYGSNDKTNWEPLYERTSSDTSDDFGTNTGTEDAKVYASDTLKCSIDNQYARYVKIEYTSQALATEIKVYADVPVTDVAKGKTATANCEHSSTFAVSKGVDGNRGTAYMSKYDGSSHRHYYQVDLGKPYHIGMIDYESRRGNNESAARSKWYAYGSNEIDTSTLGTHNASMPSIYTRLTNRTNTTIPNTFSGTTTTYVKSYSELVDASTAYQYITLVKQDKNVFQVGELKAMLVNPEVVDFEYQDGIAKVTFSEEMYMDNVSDNILIYGDDGEQKEVQLNVSDDNTSVSFEASVGDKIVVSESITNNYGTDMQEDVEYDIYDLSIDYSGKPTKKFKNMNVAYGKNVISDYVPDQADKEYYAASKLTDGVDNGYVSATKETFIVDLGRAYNVNKIVLRETDKNNNDGSKIHYTLSASADGETWVQIDKAPTAMANINTEVWDGRVGTYNINEDVNYRYIKYYHPYYQTLTEIEVYADVEATKVTQKSNNVTSSAVGDTYQGYNKYLVDNSANLTYVNAHNSVNNDSGTNTLLNWISVEMDQAYPVGMYELYVRDWKADGSHGMGSWQNNHYVKLYGSNKAATEQLAENTTNLTVKDLTPYGFVELADTFSADPYSSLFPVGFDSKQKMPEGWIFTNVYRETLNNTTRYKNLTLKKYYPKYYYTMEFGEFAAYVLNSTINVVDTSSTGVDIHFGDKMVPDLLNAETVTLKKDGTAIDYAGSLSDNKMVYSLDAALADGFYTLTVSKDVKNAYGVPMQADYTYGFVIGDVYGIKTLDGADVEALAPSTTYVVSEPISGEDARMAIAAIYDASDKLIVTSITDIPADYSNEYVQINITTPETLEAGAKVKYFLWKTGTLEPVIEAIPVIE